MYVKMCGLHAVHEKNFRIRRPSGSGDYLFLHLKSPTRFFLENEKIYDGKTDEIMLYRKGTPQFFGEAAGITSCVIISCISIPAAAKMKISFRGYP